LPGDGRFSRLLDAGKLSQAAEGSFSAVALLDHFRNRDTAKFFQGFSDRAGTIAELRGRFHAGHDAVVKAADNIIEGKFDLLGFHGISFGQPPDWHLEPISTRRVPLAHWSRINYLDSQVAGDKKIIWELNRHQYFATLGRAYWRTGDERYAAEIVKHIVDWMDHNPPGQGINWASSLEVSFRSISWIWALYFFRHSPALTAIVFWRILKHLYVHGLHIETYLSTHYSPNTHLTGEALGLFYLGTLLPEFRCARRWRTLGHNILVQELGRQVRKDGVYFEQTSYYQRYTAEFYTHFYLLKQINSEPIEPELKDKLRGLLDHLMFLTRPDGTTPLIGDDDGGRLVTIDERRRNDFRAALVSGAIVLDNPQYKYVAGAASEESLWLCGSAGLSMYDTLQAEPPKEDSRAFVDGGYYVMRDGWTRDDNFLVIDCGAHGSLSCGHAHADALSIDAAAGGRTLLVDPGTYTYTGSAELRDDFRHAGNHNTVTIDNESSSIPNGPFSWSQIARCTTHQWHDHQRGV